VLLTAAIAAPELPVTLISLLFCYSLGLMGIISPDATGSSPIYNYGSGYVSRIDFRTLGLIFGAIYPAVPLVIGVRSSLCHRLGFDRRCLPQNEQRVISSTGRHKAHKY
jgi:di/tricarboxylate transporter